MRIIETSLDEKERFRAVQEAERVLLEDVACIPMFIVHKIYAWNKKVKGVKLTNIASINVTTGWGANMWIDE